MTQAQANRWNTKCSAKRDDPKFNGRWIKIVAKGRKCNECGRKILAGEQSLRFMDLYKTRHTVLKSNGKHVEMVFERALCKECAIKGLNVLIKGLERPADEKKLDRAIKRESAKLPPETDW